MFYLTKMKQTSTMDLDSNFHILTWERISLILHLLDKKVLEEANNH